MRLIQAMGLHRDGAKWNLPEAVVAERRLVSWCYEGLPDAYRRVFWESMAADVFQVSLLLSTV
jgi:hypothetical protein